MEYFVLISVAVLSFIAGGLTVIKFVSQAPKVTQEVHTEIKKTRNVRTTQGKEKIIQLIKDTVENQIQLEESCGMIIQKGILRTDVEDLLNVSSATARRYLKLLEEEDIIAQMNEPGGDIYYVLKMY